MLNKQQQKTSLWNVNQNQINQQTVTKKYIWKKQTLLKKKKIKKCQSVGPHRVPSLHNNKPKLHGTEVATCITCSTYRYQMAERTEKGMLSWTFDFGVSPIKAFGISILKAIQSYYFHCQQSLLEAIGILFDTSEIYSRGRVVIFADKHNHWISNETTITATFNPLSTRHGRSPEAEEAF